MKHSKPPKPRDKPSLPKKRPCQPALNLVSALRPQVEILDGCTLLWCEKDLQRVSKTGDAVPVGYPHRGRIVQHHATEPEDALQFIDGYRRVAAGLGCVCLFRGQTRDYYTPAGVLKVLPTIMRFPDFYTAFQNGHSSYYDPLGQWLRVLRDLGVFTESGVRIKLDGRNLGGHLVPGTVFVNHPAAIMRCNPVVAGILQHYGFPTDHLDVTTDPAVAMWFALNQAERSSDLISFRPVTKRHKAPSGKGLSPLDWQSVPALHVYIQPPWTVDQAVDHPVADLSKLDALLAVAERPRVQSAVSLPFVNFSITPPNPVIGPRVTPHERHRWPAAIVKLHFPWKALQRDDLTAETLFPKSESLYKQLLAVKAERLAIYA